VDGNDNHDKCGSAGAVMRAKTPTFARRFLSSPKPVAPSLRHDAIMLSIGDE
jgi:hypothetical protein